MGKITNMQALLDKISLSEGDKFKYDEKAIFEAYNIQEENKSSLAIKILSIFGGFLSTLAFLGFIGITGLYDSEIGLLLFGIGFIVSAIWLNKAFNKLIIDTFSISLYIIGFIMLAFGLATMSINENTIAIIISLLALCSLIITHNFILSFISVLTISGSFLFLIISNELYDLIHVYIAIYTTILAYLFLNEAKVISSNKIISLLYNPVRIGIVISLLFGLIAIGKKQLLPISQSYIWLSSILMILVIFHIVNTIIKINEINTVKNRVIIYTLCVLILVPTVFSPSISGAIVIILLSFLVNYKTGLAIGIISIIYFISQYYYDLSFTLLTKSIILFVSGIAFLLFYLFTIKNLKTNEKV